MTVVRCTSYVVRAVARCTLYVVRRLGASTSRRTTYGLQRTTSLLYCAAVASTGCAANPLRAPAALRAYEILLPARDTLGRAFAVEFERAGLRVRHEPRGGGPPVATLIYYEFAAPRSVGGRWFHGRLYDVRSSQLLAAATIGWDSLPPGVRDRARVVIAALFAPRDTALTPDEPME